MLLGGCHAVDLLRYLVDDEVVEVSAMSNNHKGLFEYDANVVALCKFRGGVVAKASVLFDCTMPYTFNIDFAGTEGTLRDNRLWSTRLLPGQSGWATIPTTMIDSADVHRHPFDDEINDLVRAIRDGGQTECSVADAYRSHELCLAIDRSFATGGGVVKLPLDE
jgi:predicted dehydrogenase